LSKRIRFRIVIWKITNRQFICFSFDTVYKELPFRGFCLIFAVFPQTLMQTKYLDIRKIAPEKILWGSFPWDKFSREQFS